MSPEPAQVEPAGADPIGVLDTVGSAVRLDHRVLRDELWIVLFLSIAASALRSVLSLVDSLTKNVPLSDQTAVIVGTYSADRPWLDLTYQLTGIALALVPVLLVAHLLHRSGEGMRGIGFDATQPRRDVVRGMVLAAAIGSGGLVLYIVAYRLGLSVKIAAASTITIWWTVPVLLLQAAYNAVLEEVIVLGYMIHRLGQLGARPWVAIGTSAALRGSYHLYQGFGGFVGNFVMGLVFGVLYRRWGRCTPMVVAHFLLDAVSFVGYFYLHGKVGWLP
ncbi:MAG: CPBP family intramembrane glutamic endopeptidase [Candidatus Nanopelagicales bacterium]